MGASGGKSETRWPWPLAIVVWLIFVGAMSYSLFPRIAELNLNDSDDYMRLVQVEAWLDGADWRDMHMERLNPPDGVVMHWSRLPDVPIALVIAIIEPFTDRATASIAALFVVPSVYLLLFLLLITWAAARTLGPSAAFLAPILTAFALPATGQFAPGRIDHHGLQILLAILMLVAVIQLFKSPSSRWAAVMGFAGGLSIAIGAEGLPHVIASYVCLGLGWIFGRDHLLRAGVVMATATAATTALILTTTVPQSPYFAGACDALSVVYVTATALIAAIWLTLWALESRLSRPIFKAGIAGGLAALASVVLLAAFPQCSIGPYAALPPELIESWLSEIKEAQNARQLFENNFGQFALYFTLPLVALGSLALITFRRRPMPEYLIPLGVFLVLTLLVSMIQVRAGSIA
ncbi:MAG: hypothetical protein O2910_08130, partial [Proteobacteria bacterium]|nr:hypothetical protein [Pseudomonadota bacterium]